jgi:hypothetical protein
MATSKSGDGVLLLCGEGVLTLTRGSCAAIIRSHDARTRRHLSAGAAAPLDPPCRRSYLPVTRNGATRASPRR